jgi:cytochrome-b5 reductase
MATPKNNQEESFKFNFKSFKPDTMLTFLILGFIAFEVNYIYENAGKPRRNILIPTQFTLCDIMEIQQISSDTKFYKIRATNSDVKIPFHVTIKDDSCQVGRNYTPITNDGKEIGLLIKKYPNGSISTMMDNLKVGDLVHVRGPAETMVPYQPNTLKEIGMVAGGTGITFMYQLIKEIVQNKEDSTKIKLIYCSKDYVLLKNELEVLQAKNKDRLEVKYFIDQGKCGVTKEDLKFLPSSSLGEDMAVLVCGNDG